MPAAISIPQLRKRLPVGAVFTAEFIGSNRSRVPVELHSTKRVVKKNTPKELQSEFLDGPKIGERVFLGWTEVEATDHGDYVVLTMWAESFLKIQIESPSRQPTTS